MEHLKYPPPSKCAFHPPFLKRNQSSGPAVIPLFIFRADLDPAALPVICDPHKDRPVSLLQRERRASACA